MCLRCSMGSRAILVDVVASEQHKFNHQRVVVSAPTSHFSWVCPVAQLLLTFFLFTGPIKHTQTSAWVIPLPDLLPPAPTVPPALRLRLPNGELGCPSLAYAR